MYFPQAYCLAVSDVLHNTQFTGKAGLVLVISQEKYLSFTVFFYLRWF